MSLLIFHANAIYKNFRSLALTVPDQVQSVTDRRTEMSSSKVKKSDKDYVGDNAKTTYTSPDHEKRGLQSLKLIGIKL